MSDEEFLARWSRRKREAKAAVDAPPPIEPAETPNPAPSAAAGNPPDAEVDLASLPPIESITAATDITAFLRKGIPQELSRAALRRAWAADPAIRDFVGLAENAWDFNDPHAMPGFGPLDCSEERLAELVDRIVGGVRRVADSLAAAPTEQEVGPQPVDTEHVDTEHADTEHKVPSGSRAEAIPDHGPPDEISTGESAQAPAAAQLELFPSAANDQVLLRRRTHGSALPR